MPGVNLDLLPASEPPEASGRPTESRLEEVIRDLLAREEAKDEKQTFEVALRCAVVEMHSDLQVCGKQLDVRLEKTANQVAFLVEAITKLLEENLRLRTEQDKIVCQVEALCQAMGLSDHFLCRANDKESSSLCLRKTKATGLTLHTHQEITDEAPWGVLASPHCDSSPSHQDAPASSHLSDQTDQAQDFALCSKDLLRESLETNTQTSEDLQTPAFTTHRSLSAPSLLESSSPNTDMVLSMYILVVTLFEPNE